MRIDSSRGIAVAPEFRARRRDPKPEPLVRAKSLVATGDSVNANAEIVRSPRNSAAFIAQLIAREQHAEPTRVRNRAEPAEATQIYKKMLNLSGAPTRYTKRGLARPF
jgi:hypothetical protein